MSILTAIYLIVAVIIWIGNAIEQRSAHSILGEPVPSIIIGLFWPIWLPAACIAALIRKNRP